MSQQLLLYYHYQLRSHQNISTKCYACWYYQVRNFINILKQLIGRLLKKNVKIESSVKEGFIKAQIGGSTYRQAAQDASTRNAVQAASNLQEVRTATEIYPPPTRERQRAFILLPPRDGLSVVKIKQIHVPRGLGHKRMQKAVTSGT